MIYRAPVNGIRNAASSGKVLIVDDDPADVELVSRMIVRLGYTIVTAADGHSALSAVQTEHPDVVLLDVDMPLLDGFEVCRLLKDDPATTLIPVVLLTALSAVKDRVRGIDAGADDFLTKPFAATELEARLRSLTRLKRYTDQLDSAEAVILSLGRTIEARDPGTQGHCARLAGYATALGARLGLGDDQQRALHLGGYLHDLGKVGVPDVILLKPGRLEPGERVIMQQHAAIGDGICRELRMLKDVSPIVRHHHEKTDGTGYPDHLSGDAIPLLAQIMSIVDIYDALTTKRPYKPAFPPDVACAFLQHEARQGWKSAQLVDEFVSIAPSLTVHAGA